MYEIATGPSHFDYFLNNKKVKINFLFTLKIINNEFFKTKFNGRLNFDIKMQQKVKISIISEKIFCQLFNSEELYKAYNFSIKICV